MSFLFYLDVCCHATWPDATSQATWSVWGPPYTYICVTCQVYYYWDLSGWFTSIASVHTLTKALAYSNTRDSWMKSPSGNGWRPRSSLRLEFSILSAQVFGSVLLYLHFLISYYCFLITQIFFLSFFYFFIITIHSMQCPLKQLMVANNDQEIRPPL